MSKAQVLVAGQVRGFIASLAPEPKKKLRAGLRALESDEGDIADLVDDLLGYKRLRVGQFRVIYMEVSKGGKPVRECVFAERRNVVYELFAKMVLDDLS